MEHDICRPVKNSDVSLGYQFCIQLLPAIAVNIIIIHPWDVVFPWAKASAGNNCFIIPKFYLQ
jgi:hypothetical protein